MAPQVSVIIPTMKGREALLEKLLKSLPEDVEKIVVGDDNLLLAAKRNKGARQAKGKYLLFIDDDNYIKEFSVSMMVKDFSENIGVMGMVACYDDKKRRVADGGSYRTYLTGFTQGQHTNAAILDLPLSFYLVDEVANAFMIPREVFDAAGGFDELNFPIDLDEADICKRIIDMGYLVAMNPRAICYHKSQTYSHVPDFRRPMNAYFMGRNRILYQKKHLSKLKLAVYFAIFCPIFVFAYAACLLYRRKPAMVIHFLKGVRDGISGRKENPYQ